MARYEHLPIYKKAMELSLYLQNTVRNFSRYNKYSIGADLRDISRNILLLIIRAPGNKLPGYFRKSLRDMSVDRQAWRIYELRESSICSVKDIRK